MLLKNIVGELQTQLPIFSEIPRTASVFKFEDALSIRDSHFYLLMHFMLNTF
jgi:hypothetical protein